MNVENALDIQQKVESILDVLDMRHIIGARIICMRSKNSKANAYARIWSLPAIWRKALELNPFYILEVLSEKFDSLNEEEKTKVLIHELMHIPKKFSGGLVPHINRGVKINRENIEKIYSDYKKRVL